jgi:hypothetical protein
MIKRVAKHVVQRRVKSGEYVAINRHVLADDFKSRFFAELPRKVAYGARKGGGRISEWPHTTRQHLVIELARCLLAASNGAFDGRKMRENPRTPAFRGVTRAAEQLRVKTNAPRCRAQPIQLVFESKKIALELHRLIAERREASRLKQ